MTKRKLQYWVIPPDADAEFVAHMEDVIETYEKPYDPARPVVCMDEQPVQLVRETRTPLAATKSRPKRVDYEYERAALGMAAGDGPPAEDQGRLGDRDGGPLGRTLCGLRGSDPGLRQLEHAYDRRVL